MQEPPTWVWEKTDPDRSGSSGDLAKLFKNEPVKNPGAFAAEPPSEYATLMAREVIQNSADAARELQEEFDDDAPEFAVDFEFSSLEGDDKSELVAALGLREIAARGTNPSEPGWRSRLGLDEHDVLDELESPSPLRILQITERGTTGMYGPFKGASSKMYLALIALGYTAKLQGSGGSYGYGKAGLIRGSAVRMVVAYSAFAERDDDPGITRRLLGMTYWGQHDLDGESYTGFARMGAEQTNGAVHPFENDAADEMAERLGLEVRDPFDVDDLGTTFLLIAPTVEAEDLNHAIARNWWPAIEDRTLTVSILHEGGYLTPRPMKDPLLRTFVDAYHIATTNQDASKPERYRNVMKRAKVGDDLYALGSLGLLADPGGWSYSTETDGDGDSDGRSLVALVRGPRMVVEYFVAGRARPYVRGVFVADAEIDDLLRQTEPKSHDAWQTSASEAGTDANAVEVAKLVEKRIKDHVRRFRERLKPEARPAEDVRLPELSRLFGRMLSGRGKPVGPGATERPFSIHVKTDLIETGTGLLRVVGTVEIAMSDSAEADKGLVDLDLDYRFVEVGGAGTSVPMVVRLPAGFEPAKGDQSRFRGTLTKDRKIFVFESDSYRADWSGKLKAEVEFVTEAELA